MKERIRLAFETFLTQYSGTVTAVTAARRHNHQNASPPGDGMIECITVLASFENAGLFGTSGAFLDEVYPRYRFLRHRLAQFMAKEGIQANVKGSALALNIVPSLSAQAHLGDCLPKDPESSRGARIGSIEELTAHSAYYRRLARRFSIENCLLTNKDTVVGPDAGILTTVWAATRTFEGPVRVIEAGTGAGTTPLLLTRAGRLSSYVGNDFSPEAIDFFQTVVRPLLSEQQIASGFVAGSCYDIDFMNPADLIVIGVFYQAQPDLLNRRGAAIAESLAGGGVLVIQSSKPENPFITELLSVEARTNTRWPWYEEGFCLRRYFPNIRRIDVEDETMLIASCDARRADAVVELLRAENHTSAEEKAS